MKIINARINGIENPTGFNYEQLSCSWNVCDTQSKKQTNAVIEISDTKDLKNILYKKEGKDLVQSGEKLELQLKPRTTYYYRITVTGDNGDSAVSDINIFETGKMDEEWKAEWISTSKEDTFHPIMVKEFCINKDIKRARLYATGVGLFEIYINDKKVNQEFLMPYINNYETNIQVITFDLDNKLEKENTLKIMLGKGWYMGLFGLDLTKENYGNRMAAIAELYLEYEDGTEECIITDSSWQYYGSNIEDSGIYDGEIYNCLLWDKQQNPKKPVEALESPELQEGTKNLIKSHLIDRISLPVIVKQKLEVQQIIYTPAGETVLDMGQNFAGFIEFKSNFEKGTKIVLDFGEILQGGNFYNKNYRDAKSQFVYISDGTKQLVRPHFTFFGFRYVRVSGWKGTLNKEDFVGNVIYSDIHRTGYINTSNNKINRLYQNTIWGLQSNFIDIPTDCPQRSERLGWTGDAQVFAPTASYHMDTRAFFHKFIKDLRDEQKYLDGGVPNYVPNIGHKKDVGSVWGDIAALLPNTLYIYYADLKEMEYCYPLMKAWVDYIDKKDEERKHQYLYNFGFTFGDWLALDGSTPTSFKGSTDDYYISSIYYYRSVQIVREMAERLNKKQALKYYLDLENKIKKAIFNEYFTPSGRLSIDTQSAYVIALKFGVYINRNKLIEQFKLRLQKDCNSIKCGFVGAPLLCTVLAEVGLYELAYNFLLKEKFPSWLYSVNLGATTIWERWNSVQPDGTISDTGMNSLNHYAYGSVIEFVYAYAAGIRPLEAGFKKAIIAPQPDIRLKSVECAYESVNGLYICNWEIKEDGNFKIHIEIPFNCEAEIILPRYTEPKLILSSGKYDFEYKPLQDFRKPYHKGTTLERLTQDNNAIEILKKYTPALAGIVLSGDSEMGANTLEQVCNMGYLPIEPQKLKMAIKEICNLQVQ